MEEIEGQRQQPDPLHQLPVAFRSSKDRKRKRVQYVYGNYHSYYGYRIGHSLPEDPRLQLFRKEWIENRVCLDIGCNEGYMSIFLAQKFGCKSMLGIDIDPALIAKARHNLQESISFLEDYTNGKAEKSSEMELSCVQSNAMTEDLLHEIIHFKTENYLESPSNFGTYDTILCLSVTKWIHLNWGDEGLIKLFCKIKSELRPGGLLVLEPQPWKSYQSKRSVSDRTKRKFREAMFRPENFSDILIHAVGFVSCEEITSVALSTAGFNRPIYVYRSP